MAIMLAVAGAIAFGVAAVAQHHAVQRSVQPLQRHLAIARIGALLRDRAWRTGFAVLVVGTVLHVGALSLAPISLTQPINVLSVPTSLVVTALVTRRRPSAVVWLGVAGVIIGVAVLVMSITYSSDGTTPAPQDLALFGAALVTVTVVLHAAARRSLRPRRARFIAAGWFPPALLAVAGALNYGAASSTFRLLARDLGHEQLLGGRVVVALMCSIPLSLAAGSWSIHQAYAAGAAPAVTATSALLDPLVASMIGISILGETLHLSPTSLVLVIMGAALAAAGVIILAGSTTNQRPPDGLPPLQSPASDSAVRSLTSKDPLPCTSCSPPTNILSTAMAQRRSPSD